MMRHETLIENFSEAAKAAGGVYLFVMADEPFETFLSLDGVAGVVLAARDDDLARRFPGRIGWVDGTRNEIRMPTMRAGAAIGLSQRPEPGLLLLRHLRACGVRQIGHFSGTSGRLELRPVVLAASLRIARGLLARVVGQRILSRLSLLQGEGARPPTVTDTTNADEETWTRALARIDWSGKPLLGKPADFVSGKIMIVTGSLGAGGSERQVVYTALGLQRLGAAPTVVVTRRDGAANFFGPKLEVANIAIIELPQVDVLATAMGIYRFKKQVDAIVAGFDGFCDEVIRYAHLFERTRPSIVHIWLDWPNCAAGLAALAVGVPRIIVGGRSLSPVHFAFLRSFMRPAYRQLARSPRVSFLNNSRAGAHDYAAWLGITSDRITVIPNAVDAEEHRPADPDRVRAFRQEHRLPEGTPVLGGIFRMMPEKRPMLWLEIAALVGRSMPETRFVLVGGGPESAVVKARAAELGLADKLIATGETTDVATPLALMSCFLLTSRVEGLPNVLLEAQLSGVPVVTSAVGGAPETIDPAGRAGTVVEGDNPSDYAEAILAWLRDPERLRATRECLPGSVLDRFGTRLMLDATLAAYGIDARRLPFTPER